jgi:hypothetical protein
MKKPFDIFWYGESGPTWIEAVETLETAKTRIEKCLMEIHVATPSLTKELATAFRLPKNFKPAASGLGKVCPPDGLRDFDCRTCSEAVG